MAARRHFGRQKTDGSERGARWHERHDGQEDAHVESVLIKPESIVIHCVVSLADKVMT